MLPTLCPEWPKPNGRRKPCPGIQGRRVPNVSVARVAFLQAKATAGRPRVFPPGHKPFGLKGKYPAPLKEKFKHFLLAGRPIRSRFVRAGGRRTPVSNLQHPLRNNRAA